MMTRRKKNRLTLLVCTIAGQAAVWGYGWFILKLPIVAVLIQAAGMLVLCSIMLVIDRIGERIADRRELSALGKCTRCHYDLRASKDRCPECGTPIPPQKAPAPHA